jgi:hydroxymethylbilane synthase
MVTDLRGNVNTRLRKLAENDWNGAVFAKAGLERINLLPDNYITLDWMIPAPAQGAMVVVAMEHDGFCREALSQLNHRPTEVATHIERQFLKRLEGGCTAPIGALVSSIGNDIRFEGSLLSINGQQKLHIEKVFPANDDYSDIGNQCADELLQNGGAELMAQIKNQLNK